MAYDPTMGRGMSGGQPGRMGGQQGMPRGGVQRQQPMGRPATAAPQPGMRPRREPTVGESLSAQSSGFGASAQEEQFLVNLGIGALKNAHDMGLQRQERTPGMQPPPNQQRMASFQQNMQTPRYGAPRTPNIQQRRQRAMNPRQVSPQMFQQSQMGQGGFQQHGPPQPPPGYGGFGTQPMMQQQPQWSPMQQPQGFGAMQQQFNPQFRPQFPPQNMGFYNPYIG